MQYIINIIGRFSFAILSRVPIPRLTAADSWIEGMPHHAGMPRIDAGDAAGKLALELHTGFHPSITIPFPPLASPARLTLVRIDALTNWT
jgi:hypothetical protein